MNVQKGPWGSIDLNFVSPIFLYDNQLILLGTVREDTTCPEGGFNCVILCVLSAAPFYPEVGRENEPPESGEFYFRGF